MPDVDWIRKLCLSFPDSHRKHPVGRRPLLQGARQTLHHRRPLSRQPRAHLLSNARPEHSTNCSKIEGISPAPYVGRYKWVLLANSNILPSSELEALIRQSYELVVAKAPKKKTASKESAAKRRKK